MQLNELETPALVLDRSKMENNINRLREQLKPFDIVFRPHLKTCKSADVARYVTEPGGPITVSTLKEAEYFLEHGWTDILYAVGIAANKFAHVASLISRGANMTVILDNAETAAALATFCDDKKLSLPVLLEIDTDGHRSGIVPESDELLNVAGHLRPSNADGTGAWLAGVMTHAGESYNCKDTNSIVAMAEQERRGAVTAAQRLRAAGFDAPTVSVGSTPTAHFAQSLDGVTEVRAGVYVFFDLVMAGLQVCTPEDIALSVLCTVIGHQKEKGWLITDAGWMAMSRDRGTQNQRVDQGYGLVCSIDGKIMNDIIMSQANQEHGIIMHRDDSAKTPMLPVGTMLRILPNHACSTAAQHQSYKVVDEGQKIEAEWTRFSGW